MKTTERPLDDHRENLALMTDSYKEAHHQMYPDGTGNIFSYYEARRGAEFPETVFFGLQAYLKKYLTGQVVSEADVNEAEAFCRDHFLGLDLFNRAAWDRIINVHGGRLPLRIRAVPEGTPVPISNVMMTVEVTDPECAPFTNFFETLLTHIWYPSNVATISRHVKARLKEAMDKSADGNAGLPFLLHDFGFRGASSVETAGMGGMAHLVNFQGTDTIMGIRYAQRYYGADMAGFSVPASEHSIATALRDEGEIDMVRRLIRLYPDGILSHVSDSYDIDAAIDAYGTELKEDILKRNGKFVVRLDSPRYEGETAAEQVVWAAGRLAHWFGTETNQKGYKVLNPKVGLLYGDGLSFNDITECANALVEAGFAADTCVYGMGGGLLQKHNRDTQRIAFKCAAQLRDGKWEDVFKNPKDASKASKRGRLKLVREDGEFRTVREEAPGEDELVTVFENGELVREWTFDEVRARAEIA